MRTCKKLVALVMALAMLATMFAFSASAAAVATVTITGGDTALEGSEYIVSVNVTDADAVVGGMSGVITVEGATLSKIVANEALLKANNNATQDTVVKEGTNSFKFAAVGDDGEWFKLTLTDLVADATIKVTASDIAVSNATGSAKLVADTDYTVTNLTKTVEALDTGIYVSGTGMRDEKDVTKQGMRYRVAFDTKFSFDGVTEFGVVYIPKQLLDSGAKLEVGSTDTDVRKLSVTMEDPIVNYVKNDKAFFAYVNTGVSGNETRSYSMLGVRVLVRAYYVKDGKTYYSNNTDTAAEGGIADKAVLNVALAMAEPVETKDETGLIASIVDDKTLLVNGTGEGENAKTGNELRQYLIDFVCDEY